MLKQNNNFVFISDLRNTFVRFCFQMSHSVVNCSYLPRTNTIYCSHQFRPALVCAAGATTGRSHFAITNHDSVGNRRTHSKRPNIPQRANNSFGNGACKAHIMRKNTSPSKCNGLDCQSPART